MMKGLPCQDFHAHVIAIGCVNRISEMRIKNRIIGFKKKCGLCCSSGNALQFDHSIRRRVDPPKESGSPRLETNQHSFAGLLRIALIGTSGVHCRHPCLSCAMCVQEVGEHDRIGAYIDDKKFEAVFGCRYMKVCVFCHSRQHHDVGPHSLLIGADETCGLWVGCA